MLNLFFISAWNFWVSLIILIKKIFGLIILSDALLYYLQRIYRILRSILVYLWIITLIWLIICCKITKNIQIIINNDLSWILIICESTIFWWWNLNLECLSFIRKCLSFTYRKLIVVCDRLIRLWINRSIIL